MSEYRISREGDLFVVFAGELPQLAFETLGQAEDAIAQVEALARRPLFTPPYRELGVA